jgi:hypothetical protein
MSSLLVFENHIRFITSKLFCRSTIQPNFSFSFRQSFLQILFQSFLVGSMNPKSLALLLCLLDVNTMSKHLLRELFVLIPRLTELVCRHAQMEIVFNVGRQKFRCSIAIPMRISAFIQFTSRKVHIKQIGVSIVLLYSLLLFLGNNGYCLYSGLEFQTSSAVMLCTLDVGSRSCFLSFFLALLNCQSTSGLGLPEYSRRRAIKSAFLPLTASPWSLRRSFSSGTLLFLRVIGNRYGNQ